jgi:hypothetical protein
MSGMVAVVLKMTFGVFVNKARGSLSKKLKDGGLNSQQLRSLIVSNFEDIKTKLDGLARGNLLSSVSFIQEGLRLLDDLIDQPEAWWKFWIRGNCSDLALDADSPRKLAEEANEMKMKSSDYYASAMKSFENAITKATEAFHNESLSLEDRILAAKIRVQSRLLLSIENPGLASQPCRLYLEELHGIASIVEIFRNDLEGGLLSFLNREKRHELVLSVSAINFVVFKFLKSFTKGPINLYDWPTLKSGGWTNNLLGGGWTYTFLKSFTTGSPINLYGWPTLKSGGWTYNPLIPDRTLCMELGSAGVEFPYLFELKEFGWRDMECYSLETVAVNSNGEVIVGYIRARSRDVIFGKVAMNKVKTSAISGKGIRTYHLLLLVVDSNDNMYVLADGTCVELFGEFEPSGSVPICPSICDLTAFDSNNLLIEQVKNLLIEQVGCCPGMNILVPTPDGFALMSYNGHIGINTHVAFYKNSEGKIQRTFTFETKLWELSLITVTNKYQVVAVEQSGYHVRIYEKDGKLIREFELFEGERESCVSIAFNYLTEELVFVSRVGSWYFLSTYEPETGKRRHNVRLTLFGTEEQCLRLTAHCSGPMALVSSEYVLYLQ